VLSPIRGMCEKVRLLAPLDEIRAAAEAVKEAGRARVRARQRLAEAIRSARADGVPLTVCARAAGVSRKTAERLLKD
jgi:predicted peroxiredoxin